MRNIIFLSFVLCSLKLSAQQGESKTPFDYIQRIIHRSFYVPEDTTSIFVFRIIRTADTLVAENIFSSSKNGSGLKKLLYDRLNNQLPKGFRCVVTVHCYRLFDEQSAPSQPDKSILDSAAAVVARHGQEQTFGTPVVVMAYPPSCELKRPPATINKMELPALGNLTILRGGLRSFGATLVR